MGGVGLGHRKKWPTAQITTSCGWKSLTPSMAHESKWHIIHVNLCLISSINRPDLLKGQDPGRRHPIQIIFSPAPSTKIRASPQIARNDVVHGVLTRSNDSKASRNMVTFATQPSMKPRIWIHLKTPWNSR